MAREAAIRPSAGARQPGVVDDDLPKPGIVADEGAAILGLLIDGVVGLGLEVRLAMPSASSSSGSGDPAPPVEEDAAENEVEAPAPWEALSDPSCLGYLCLGGRSLMRVQYWKPRTSCTISCYRHRNCHALISMSRVPELSALIVGCLSWMATREELRLSNGRT